jgi:hypothetical protein
MKHLLTEQTPKGVTVKCGVKTSAPGKPLRRDDVTIWWSEVDCPKCRAYRFMPVPADDPIGGMKMVYVGTGEEPPVVKPRRRIIRTPRA